MALSQTELDVVASFRGRFEEHYAGDARFGEVSRVDREDGSQCSTRFQVADDVWLDLTVRPGIPQLRAGIVTDDRWKNEELEDAIEETGDSMSEFVELGFDEAGLDWAEPPVEHYREDGKYFIFATAFEAESVAALGDDAVFDRIRRIFDGYYEAFRGAIARLNAEAE